MNPRQSVICPSLRHRAAAVATWLPNVSDQGRYFAVTAYFVR
jgi:hypothetical protein